MYLKTKNKFLFKYQNFVFGKINKYDLKKKLLHFQFLSLAQGRSQEGCEASNPLYENWKNCNIKAGEIVKK